MSGKKHTSHLNLILVLLFVLLWNFNPHLWTTIHQYKYKTFYIYRIFHIYLTLNPFKDKFDQISRHYWFQYIYIYTKDIIFFFRRLETINHWNFGHVYLWMDWGLKWYEKFSNWITNVHMCVYVGVQLNNLYLHICTKNDVTGGAISS